MEVPKDQEDIRILDNQEEAILDTQGTQANLPTQDTQVKEATQVSRATLTEVDTLTKMVVIQAILLEDAEQLG